MWRWNRRSFPAVCTTTPSSWPTRNGPATSTRTCSACPSSPPGASGEDLRGKEREYCHTFFGLADGSALAFFQFADADDYAELSGSMPTSLNHVALAVDADGQGELIGRLDAHEVRYRVVDHGYCRSLYVSDPDGLTVEFTCDAANADEIDARRRADAHSELQRWLAGDRTPNNDLR